MKKLLLSLIIMTGSLFAEIINVYPDAAFLSKKIPTVDIRTQGEWKETGVLKGAIPITFFDEKGGYDISAFLKELSSKVDVKKPFALICRTGSRTRIVSNFLSQKMGYHVYDLSGGMMYVLGKKLPIIPYNK